MRKREREENIWMPNGEKEVRFQKKEEKRIVQEQQHISILSAERRQLRTKPIYKRGKASLEKTLFFLQGSPTKNSERDK